MLAGRGFGYRLDHVEKNIFNKSKPLTKKIAKRIKYHRAPLMEAKDTAFRRS